VTTNSKSPGRQLQPEISPSTGGANRTRPDPLFAVAYDWSGSGLAAAARWDGIYLSGDNGGHWVSAQGNALPIAFTDVKWANGSIYATTFGQGVVQLPVKIKVQTQRTAIHER